MYGFAGKESPAKLASPLQSIRENALGSVCDLWNRRWTAKLLSRLLVLLTTLLLFAMPATEYFCNWDRFLRGGPDVEFSILAWLLFAAMVVLTMNGTMLRPAWMQAAKRMRATSENDAARRAAVLAASMCSAGLFSHSGLAMACISGSRSSVPLRI